MAILNAWRTIHEHVCPGWFPQIHRPIKSCMWSRVRLDAYLHDEADGCRVHSVAGERRQQREVVETQLGRHTLDQGDHTPVCQTTNLTSRQGSVSQMARLGMFAWYKIAPSRAGFYDMKETWHVYWSINKKVVRQPNIFNINDKSSEAIPLYLSYNRTVIFDLLVHLTTM